ncbi:MAG: phospholipase [Bacteroidales bacterium]|nr:phospholipase [Candidatus Sodaliphilus aphodohippi]
MIASLILLALLGAVGAVLYYFDRKKRGDQPVEVNLPPEDSCSDDCCSTHDVCPSQKLLECMTGDIAYFDDEELDAFAGRGADNYTDAEIEQFRDVLYTLQAEDRLPWERSLKRRGITMPATIRQEFIMLAGE